MMRYKMVIYVPGSHADAVRMALAAAGAGIIGNYTHCTFTISGTGRFMPNADANPTIGTKYKLEEVAEDRIETVCDKEHLKAAIAAVRAVHPYEEPALDVYPIEIIE